MSSFFLIFFKIFLGGIRAPTSHSRRAIAVNRPYLSSILLFIRGFVDANSMLDVGRLMFWS
jgi:hypothetical protein